MLDAILKRYPSAELEVRALPRGPSSLYARIPWDMLRAELDAAREIVRSWTPRCSSSAAMCLEASRFERVCGYVWPVPCDVEPLWRELVLSLEPPPRDDCAARARGLMPINETCGPFVLCRYGSTGRRQGGSLPVCGPTPGHGPRVAKNGSQELLAARHAVRRSLIQAAPALRALDACETGLCGLVAVIDAEASALRELVDKLREGGELTAARLVAEIEALAP